MELPRPSEATIARFRALFPALPEAVERKMFGQLAGFVNGNMFTGLFGDEIQVRLAEPDRTAAFAAGARTFEPMGRAMKEYVVLPDEIVQDPDRLSAWVERAYLSALARPPKEPGAKKARATRKA